MAAIMRTPQYTVDAGRRTITVSSTNQLVKSGRRGRAGGQDRIHPQRGYCLATLLRLPQGGREVAVVVLGAKSNAGRSGKPATCSTGCRPRRRICWAAGSKPPLDAPLTQ